MSASLLALAFLVVQQVSPRSPAPLIGVRGTSWLERDGREGEQRPQEIFKAMGLSEGDFVADVGCGTGWFSRRMAPIVGTRGRILAVDIQAGMLDALKELADKEHITNIEPILGSEVDPKLPEGALDWVLIVDAYHEFAQPRPMLEAIRRSLKRQGRVALIEYRKEGSTATHVGLAHRMSSSQILSEWLPAGFRLVRQLEFLPTQHFFVFDLEPAPRP